MSVDSSGGNLIRGTYTTDKTICAIRSIVRKTDGHTSVLIPQEIRDSTEFEEGTNVEMAVEDEYDTIYISTEKEKLGQIVDNMDESYYGSMKIDKWSNRITIPRDEINEGLLEGMEDVAVEYHKEMDIVRIRPAVQQDIYSIQNQTRQNIRSTLTSTQASFVKQHEELFSEEIPEPDKIWSISDVGIDKHKIRGLSQRGLIYSDDECEKREWKTGNKLWLALHDT